MFKILCESNCISMCSRAERGHVFRADISEHFKFIQVLSGDYTYKKQEKEKPTAKGPKSQRNSWR